MMEFRAVSVGYGQVPVLQQVSFTVLPGTITALVGPNGCGKTTLLRAAARQLPTLAGKILLDGQPVGDYARLAFARAVALLPQQRQVPALTVQALVSHGRYPYLGLSRQLRAVDRQAVQRAMQATGVDAWAERDLRALSGGERQRVYIAMALAQDAATILLDEPTAYLDIGRQFELMELLQTLNAGGKTILLVLHDLAQALRYSHQVVLLADGGLVQCGSPEALVQSGKLEATFGVKAHRVGEDYYFTSH